MIEEDMARLIELNEKIVSQNDEIIRLLLKLAGEGKSRDDSITNPEVKDSGYDVLVNEGGKIFVDSALSGINLGDFSSSEQSKQMDEKDFGLSEESGENLLDSKLDVGEVFFIGNSEDGNFDAYKLSIKQSDEFKVSPKNLEEDIRNNIPDYNCEITIDNLTGDGITNQYNMPLVIANESLVRNEIIASGTVILDDEPYENLSEIIRFAMENGAKKVHLSLKNAMAVINAPPEILEFLDFYRTYEQIFDKLFWWFHSIDDD